MKNKQAKEQLASPGTRRLIIQKKTTPGRGWWSASTNHKQEQPLEKPEQIEDKVHQNNFTVNDAVHSKIHSLNDKYLSTSQSKPERTKVKEEKLANPPRRKRNQP